VTFGNGDGLDDAGCTTEAGRVVELDGVNTRPIAEKPPHPQAADMAVRPGDPVIIVVAPSREVDGRRTHSNRGQLFDSSVDGRVLVTRSTQPLLDGCRVLIGEGIDPVTRVVMRHAGSDKDALRSTVGAAAKLTVSDSDTGRPKFKTFKPWKRGEETGAGEAPVQETEPAVLDQPPDAHAAPAADGKGGST
jgi:hypothetical protein